MASDGDTITFSATSGDSPTTEDISSIDIITIDYLDGAGGESGGQGAGGAGGRVEDVSVDVSNHSTLYLWLPTGGAKGQDAGRYYGATNQYVNGTASAEIALTNTDRNDSSDEPFLVAAGAGGAGSSSSGEGSDSARGGAAEGTAPPAGGSGAAVGASGGDGEGAIASRTIVGSGTTSTGGGSGADTGAEAQVSFEARDIAEWTPAAGAASILQPATGDTDDN